MKKKLGRELQVGDTVSTFWGWDTITDLRPYTGPLAFLWEPEGGARVATFARNQTGMTVDPELRFKVR